MAALRCTICEKPLPPRAENPDHPFCSERCRMVDLGKWMGGEYAIPGRTATPDEVVREVTTGDDDDSRLH